MAQEAKTLKVMLNVAANCDCFLINSILGSQIGHINNRKCRSYDVLLSFPISLNSIDT